ncbi:fec operon regulator FecR [compost metagenome]|uniref:FecR family protein n=1 Tax=Sphingobacterium sp. GVS05A TaxID=2862679 RepID=UPI000FAD83F9|nr:FecR family protein [Sphingobacterium sp. GVS05A]
MKKSKTIQSIIKKYLKNKTSKQEDEQLFSFYEHIASQREDWDESLHGNKKIRAYMLWKKIDTRTADDQKTHKPFRFLLRPLMATATVAVVILGVCSLVFYQTRTNEKEPQNLVIRPGSDKAKLRLADGRTIYLDSTTSENIAHATAGAVQISEMGVLDYSNLKGPKQGLGTNTITVPRGGQFRLLLSDGTKISLNASSSLTFPTNFSGSERRVKLEGEAYFEVAKKIIKGTKTERVPFIVETDRQQLLVLGTTFNINAYPDEKNVKTTLIEGSVQVSPSEQASPKILKPGQQSVLNGKNLSIHQIDVSQAVAWKQGDFTFDEMPLEEIMRQISRWYDVEVSYEDNMGKIKFGGSISRSKDIKEVLEVLKLTGIHFNLKGRRIMVTR